MAKFTFISEEFDNVEDFPDNIRIAYSFEAATLIQIQEAFVAFLKGCQYSEELLDDMFKE